MTAPKIAAAGLLAAGLLLTGCSSQPKTAASFCALASSEQAQTVTFSHEFTTDKPADLKPVVDKALTQLSAFAAAAPPAIAAATHTYVDDERSFLTAIKGNGYDVTKSTAVIEKDVTDPAFIKAGQQLSDYLTNTCHLHAATAAATPSAG